MAVCTFKSPFERIHGTVNTGTMGAKIVALSSKYAGNYCRELVVPDDPRTDLQILMRSVIGTCAAAYNSMPRESAMQWVEAGEKIQKLNILDLPYSLTGMGLFTSITTYRILAGEDVIATVPTNLVPPIFNYYDLETDSGGPGSSLSVRAHSIDFPDNYRLFIRTTMPLSSPVRQARINELSMLSANSEDNFSEHQFDYWRVGLTPDANHQFPYGDVYIGVAMLPLTNEYLPGRLVFERSVFTEYD